MMDYRGNPSKHDPIHYKPDAKDTDVFCYFGSYHVRYTNEPKKVTCLKCQEHPAVHILTRKVTS